MKPGVQLAQAFLKFQRQRAFVRDAYVPHEISNREGKVLAFIDGKKEASASQICNELQIEKSSTSRLLKRLIESELLQERDSKSDAREKLIALTSEGRSRLHALDKTLAQITSRSLDHMTEEDELKLNSLLRTLAKKLGAPSFVERRTDHPINFGLWRITAASAMYGPSFFGTGHSVNELQVFDLLESEGQSLALSELCREIPFPKSTIAKACTKLVTNGYLERENDSKDRRRLSYKLTSEGAKERSHALTHIGETFETAMKEAKEDLSQLLSLLQLAASKGSEQLTLQDQIRIELVSSPRVRQAARAFLASAMVRQGLSFEIGPHLLPEEGEARVLTINGKVQGVADLQAVGDQLSVAHFAVAEEIVDKAVRTTFLEQAVKKSRWYQEGTKVQLPNFLAEAGESLF